MHLAQSLRPNIVCLGQCLEEWFSLSPLLLKLLTSESANESLNK